MVPKMPVVSMQITEPGDAMHVERNHGKPLRVQENRQPPNTREPPRRTRKRAGGRRTEAEENVEDVGAEGV